MHVWRRVFSRGRAPASRLLATRKASTFVVCRLMEQAGELELDLIAFVKKSMEGRRVPGLLVRAVRSTVDEADKPFVCSVMYVPMRHLSLTISSLCDLLDDVGPAAAERWDSCVALRE
jgi:hypothetical protein